MRKLALAMAGFSSAAVADPAIDRQMLLDHELKIGRIHEETPESSFIATGFALAFEGKTWLVTARHVCDSLIGDNRDAEILFPGGHRVWVFRKNWRRHARHDVCLMADVTGLIKGFEIADKLEAREVLTSISHPDGLPLTPVTGVFTGDVVDTITISTVPKLCLPAPTYEVKLTPLGRVCEFSFDLGITNMTIAGGSSGSPMLNQKGQVVGVTAVAAVNNWAGFVRLEDLKKALKALVKSGVTIDVDSQADARVPKNTRSRKSKVPRTGVP